MKHCYK